MTITVKLPDGNTAQFPDGTSPEVMKQALAKYRTGPVAMSNSERTRMARGMTDADVQGRVASATEADKDREATLRDQGALHAMMLGANQGVTFGFGDEITAGLHAAKKAVTGEGIGYDDALAGTRADLDMARRERPIATYGAELAGGAAAGGGLAGATVGTGRTVLGMAGRGALTGAAEGALYGFGSGEDGLANRAANAAQGASLGGAVGALAPVAVAGGRAALQGVSNPIQTALNIANPAKASRAIEVALRRSGMTADQIDDILRQAADEGQPEFLLADALGNPGQRMLSGVARTPGDMRNEIVEALVRRQDGQGNRLAGFVDEALNSPQNPGNLPATGPVASNVGRTGAQVVDSLKGARSAAANTAYTAARDGASPVDIRGALAVIDDRIGGMQGSGVAGDGIDAKLAGFRTRLAANPAKLPNGMTARELSDFDRVLGVKQDVQDAIGAAVRAGRNNEARELGKLVTELDSALETASTAYRSANDDFARASRVIEKVDAGAAATSSRARAQDTVQAYGGMTPDEQSAFRAGYADPTIARIDSAAPGVNKARPLRSDKAAAELGAMADDPPLLGRRIERENTMFETANQALGGSRTADNLADSAETTALSAPFIANLLTGNFRAAATQAGQTALNAASGNSEATRALIAKALMSRDIQAALAPAQRAAIKNGNVSKVIEALIRAGSLRMIGQ